MNLSDPATQNTLIEAVKTGMEVVRQNQGGHLPQDAEIKENETLVTIVDSQAEERASALLRRVFGEEVRLSREEGGKSGRGKVEILMDMLDGTRAFTNGMMSSTVILAPYDHEKKEVVGCVIGEPVSGRIWSTFGNEPTRLNGREVRVWEGKLDEQSTVFLDVSHGFARDKRQILTDKQVAALFAKLGPRMKLFLPGSNGLIQALVANGGQKVAASITTAIGGPWDVCGVKLVLNAGGVARAFSVVDYPDMFVPLILEERNPLDVMSYDILVCGNNQETVNTLVEALPLSGV